MKKFVFIFSQIHLDFRQAELESICTLYGIPCNSLSSFSDTRHVYVFEFPTVDCVTKILSRSVLLKCAIEWISNATDYDSLCADIAAKKHETDKYDSANQSFAIRIRTVGKKSNCNPSQSVIKDIGKALGFRESPVDLNIPHNMFYVIEEYDSCTLQLLHFGKLVGCGQGQLKNRYSLAERCYIGNTTMDPELSFIQANIAEAITGSLILDPFSGTGFDCGTNILRGKDGVWRKDETDVEFTQDCGGLLIAAAHFGAAVLGTEINYQVAKAVGRSSRAGVKYIGADESVAGNFRQYGIDWCFMGLVIADASQHRIWRAGTDSHTCPVFDAIITDPPYGVREKGQKVGTREKKDSWITKQNAQYTNHYPEKEKYSMSSSFLDLVDLASKLLVIGGRLLFWFPVFDDQYSEAILPKHNSLRLIYNCEQSLSRRYSRRLLAYEKVRAVRDGEKAYVEKDCYEEMTFRQRVFVKS